jgi:hypothetical protein
LAISEFGLLPARLDSFRHDVGTRAAKALQHGERLALPTYYAATKGEMIDRLFAAEAGRFDPMCLNANAYQSFRRPWRHR